MSYRRRSNKEQPSFPRYFRVIVKKIFTPAMYHLLNLLDPNIICAQTLQTDRKKFISQVFVDYLVQMYSFYSLELQFYSLFRHNFWLLLNFYSSYPSLFISLKSFRPKRSPCWDFSN